MQIKQDYYQVLGIAPIASMEETHEAYRKFAFQSHPDRNQISPSTYEKMLEKNEVHYPLSNTIQPREYDIPRGYDTTVTKFKRGIKMRVNAHASPFNDHTEVVDQEPVKGNFRFWYMVKILANGVETVIRLAEEQLGGVNE
jgi:curved DNA-binding protein CbpA